MHRMNCMIVILLAAIARLATSVHASPLADEVQERAVELLDAVVDAESALESFESMRELADAVAAVANDRQLDAIGISEGYLGIMKLVTLHQGGGIESFADSLVHSPTFVIELGLLIDRDHDELEDVVRVAAMLLKERGELVEQYAAMSSALCVVHDSMDEYSRRINENAVESPAVMTIFDYFSQNANQMNIHPNRLTPALLVHVVDMTEEPEQSSWALGRYGSNPQIGERFFEIEYDYEHFRGAPKRVTAMGNYRLQSILQYGGVCADQAYFAEGVAKACSIPSAYVYARGADVSHAWIGYLETIGRRVEWNFDSGRYPEYQNLRGNLRDPQTMEMITDARVGLLAGAFGIRNESRWAALGVAKAVQRMHEDDWNGASDVVLDIRGLRNVDREGTWEDQLALLRAGLTKCAFVPQGWELVTEIASENELTLKELDIWARAVDKMCGSRYQDFSFDVISELIESVQDKEARVGMWEWALSRYRARPDLAAATLIELGELQEELKDLDGAWRRYETITRELMNDGPMVVTALIKMRDMLEAAEMRSKILPTLEESARRVNRPPSMGAAFATQSNYFRIHFLLAQEYEHAGRVRDSRAVFDMIGVRTP